MEDNESGRVPLDQTNIDDSENAAVDNLETPAADIPELDSQSLLLELIASGEGGSGSDEFQSVDHMETEVFRQGAFRHESQPELGGYKQQESQQELQQRAGSDDLAFSGGVSLGLPSSSVGLDSRTDQAEHSDRRRAVKRSKQREYRDKVRQLRSEAVAKIAELRTLESALSVENRRLRLKHEALDGVATLLDSVVDAMMNKTSQSVDPALPFGRYTLVQTAQEMTLEEFRRLWGNWVNELAELLLLKDSGEETHVQKLESLMSVIEQFMMHLDITQPSLLEHLTSMNLETGEVEDPGLGFWLGHLRDVGLTDRQLEMLDDMVYTSGGDLEVKRQQLLAEVEAMTHQGAKQLHDLHSNTLSPTPPSTLLTTGARDPAAVVKSLENILQRKGLLGALLQVYLGRMIFSTWQKASIAVCSYPYLVHMGQVVECMKIIKKEREELARAGRGRR